MKKKIIALILSVLLLFCSFPITTVAAANVATVVAENYTVTQGGYATVYLRADNFVNVAVLDIELYYNSDVMSVNSTSKGTMFNGASVSTNTSTPGVVKISAMSATGFNSTTSNSKNRMMTIMFKVNADCPVGDYPITVTIGHAYDNEFNPANISGTSGVVTVKQAAATTFTISGTWSKSAVECGDTLSVNVTHSSSNKFASADFTIQYDREHFELESVELASGLKVEGAVHSINTSIQGLVIISYASMTAINSSNLFTLKLKAIADVDASSKITIEASDVYDDQLVSYAPYTLTKTITFTKKDVVVDYPDFFVDAGTLIVGETSQLAAGLQCGADVAAGDFTITYDANVFEIKSVTANQAVLDAGGWIIINENFHDGTIKFSYINREGSFAEDTPLVYIDLVPISAPSTHSVISTSGKDICDKSFADVTLDYFPTEVCVFNLVVTEPTCTTEGYTTYTCCCGDILSTENIIGALGHDEIPHSSKLPTCTGIGWYEYVTCSRCDYTTYVEIGALGHDEITHRAKAPTCTDVGWDTYVTCRRCDYTTYKEIAATGHHYFDGACENCGEEQPPTYSWDISANEDASIMAYCYERYDGNYFMEIVGSGKMKDFGSDSNVPWYNIRAKIVRLTISDDITHIGSYAFRYCTKLKDFKMPSGLKSIGTWAFYRCESFENVTLPEGLESIDILTFSYCTKLKNVNIPSTLKKIGGQAFTGCSALKSVTIAEGVTTIDYYAFNNCAALETIVIPKSVTSISTSSTFNGCNNLKLVICKSTTIANGITSAMAFGNLCNAACTVVIPSNATPSTYLTDTYPVSETALIDGGNYVIYSLSEHTWVDSTITEMVPCVSDGLVRSTCSTCGAYKDTIIPCHNKVLHDAKDPTCTDIGWYEYETCSRCDYTTYKEIASLGHDEISHNAKDPTCTDIGWYEYETCSRCDYTTYKEIAATGVHNHVGIVTKPTCTDQGYTTYTCSMCGDSYTDDYVKANGHTFGEWIIDVNSTETEVGSKYRECDCGAKVTGVIPQTLKFATAALTLQSNIAINFKVNAAMFTTYGYTDAYAVFRFYDADGNFEETVVTEYRIEEGTGRYLFDFENIAPNRLNDTVEGTLFAKYDGEWYQSATVSYSAATYCYRQLNNAAVSSNDAYAELRTLIVDLLNYGTAAQKHTGYRTDALANANLTETQAAWGTSTSRKLVNSQNAFYETIENPSAPWKGAGLNLKDAVVIRLKFESPDPEGLTVKIVGMYDEWEITSKDFDPVIGENNMYYVYFDELDASQMSQKIYATIYKDGVAVSNTLQYTIETYAAKNAVPGTTSGDLLIAMMRYGDAANNFVN